MMKNQYILLIKAEGTSGAIRQETYAEDERLDVRELTTRSTTQVRAQEISPYRHTLFLDGKAYAILDVVKRIR